MTSTTAPPPTRRPLTSTIAERTNVVFAAPTDVVTHGHQLVQAVLVELRGLGIELTAGEIAHAMEMHQVAAALAGDHARRDEVAGIHPELDADTAIADDVLVHHWRALLPAVAELEQLDRTLHRALFVAGYPLAVGEKARSGRTAWLYASTEGPVELVAPSARPDVEDDGKPRIGRNRSGVADEMHVEEITEKAAAAGRGCRDAPHRADPSRAARPGRGPAPPRRRIRRARSAHRPSGVRRRLPGRRCCDGRPGCPVNAPDRATARQARRAARLAPAGYAPGTPLGHTWARTSPTWSPPRRPSRPGCRSALSYGRRPPGHPQPVQTAPAGQPDLTSAARAVARAARAQPRLGRRACEPDQGWF